MKILLQTIPVPDLSRLCTCADVVQLCLFGNTAAKRLRMRQVEHFPSPVTVSVTLSSQIKVSLSFILCAAFGSVVVLHAARVFDYFVVIEIAFMDNQAQITETISRLDSGKVR